jgi:predicted amidophosphoribosyltransferase
MPTRERKNMQVCQVCDEMFNTPYALWACSLCDHHWEFHEDQCKNCYASRRNHGQRMYAIPNAPISSESINT